MSRAKILAIFLLSVSVFIGSIFHFAERAILQGFGDVERADAAKEEKKYTSAFRARMDSLEKTAIDLAKSKDAYNFVRGKAPNCINSKFTSETIVPLEIEYVFLFNSKARLIYSGDFSDPTKIKAIDPSLMIYFKSDSAILKSAISGVSTTGILSTPQGLIILSAQGINSPGKNSTPSGAVVLARKISQEFVSRIVSQLKVRSTQETIQLSVPGPKIYPYETPGGEVSIVSDTELRLTAIRNDLYGQPVRRRTLILDRPIYKKARETVRLLAFVLILASGFILLAGFQVLRSLLNRVRSARDEALVSERRLKLALEASSGGVWDYDFSNHQVHFDAKYRSILGYSEWDLPNSARVFKDLCHPEDFVRAKAKYRDFLENKSPTFSEEFRMRAKDGTYRWILSEAAALRDAKGNPVRVIGWNRDISAQKIQAKVIEEQRMQMAQTAKMTALGEMAGGIAHEINNPLAIISGHAQTITMNLASPKPELEKIRDSAQKIEDTVERIAKIIRSLKSFARDGSNDPLEPMSARRILDDSLPLAKERILKRSIQLKESFLDLDTIIKVRPSELGQVLLNLLSNAYDEVEEKEGAWIELSTRKLQNHFEISVSNSGNPIPEPIRAKIFQPFFTTKKVGQGTGLGLSISRGLMERSNGKLYYDEDAPYPRFIIQVPLDNQYGIQKAVTEDANSPKSLLNK